MYDDTFNFYERLADEYQLLFADWEQSVVKQADVLDAIIHEFHPHKAETLLDATCGIGTQAIGLARLGYGVTGSDISTRALDVARRAAKQFGVPEIPFIEADVRSLNTRFDTTFDVVISCDNALPHLLADRDLRQATQSIYERLNSGGLALLSIRDYDQIVGSADRPQFASQRVIEDESGRRVVFQLWDWKPDGQTYVVNQFVLREESGGWHTTHAATHYRAVLREELGAHLLQAGFRIVRWLMPRKSGYYQPIVLARRD